VFGFDSSCRPIQNHLELERQLLSRKIEGEGIFIVSLVALQPTLQGCLFADRVQVVVRALRQVLNGRRIRYQPYLADGMQADWARARDNSLPSLGSLPIFISSGLICTDYGSYQHTVAGCITGRGTDYSCTLLELDLGSRTISGGWSARDNKGLSPFTTI
jgi:hypothetical protein